jgi:hypothetical protein
VRLCVCLALSLALCVCVCVCVCCMSLFCPIVNVDSSRMPKYLDLEGVYV